MCKDAIHRSTLFTTEKADRLIEEYKAQTTGVIYNIMSINNAASGCVFDAMNEVRRSKYYHHQVKQLERKIERCRLNYEKVLNSVIKDCNVFLANYFDGFAEDLDFKLQIMFWTIKNMYDKDNVEDSAMKTRVKMAYEMTGMAITIFDRRMEEMRKEDIRFARFNLSYLRLTELFRLLEMLDDILCPALSEKEPVVISLTAICNMLSDGRRIIETIKQISTTN